MKIRDEGALGDLAIMGGAPMFPDRPRSTSNLVQPDFERFLGYSRRCFRPSRAGEPSLVQLLEQRLAAFHGTSHCILVSGGFWSLVLAMRALALPGRMEVVMPSLTYRRLSDIVAWAALVPHYCEIDEATLAMSPASVEACLSDQTGIILGVHTPVSCCDVVALAEIATRSGCPLLFDSVEAAGQTIAGRPVGGFGAAECFSLHASKLLNGFEGGYITTNDSLLASRLITMRASGVHGGVLSELGTDVCPDAVHAAMALATLDELDAQVERNRHRYRVYQRELAMVPGARLRGYDEHERTPHKNVLIELEDGWPLSRAMTVEVLNREGILARAYYAPAQHQTRRQYPTISGPLPLSDRLAERLILLPAGHQLAEDEIVAIVRLLAMLGREGRGLAEALRASAPAG